MLTTQERIDKLTAARTLLDEHFGTHAYAINAKGDSCGPTDPEAERFCSVGTLYRVCDVKLGADDQSCVDDLHDDLQKAAKQLFDYAGVTTINDHYGKEAALRVFDRALKNLEASA